MASNRTVYHVTPSDSGKRWVVSQQRSNSFSEEYTSKDAAVRAAKVRARGQEPSLIKVYKQDGNVEYESAYGKDVTSGTRPTGTSG
jgi:uncharacterized protein DUF2188